MNQIAAEWSRDQNFSALRCPPCTTSKLVTHSPCSTIIALPYSRFAPQFSAPHLVAQPAAEVEPEEGSRAEICCSGDLCFRPVQLYPLTPIRVLLGCGVVHLLHHVGHLEHERQEPARDELHTRLAVRDEGQGRAGQSRNNSSAQ